MTAWRRLRDWQQAGVWKRAHETVLERLNAAGAIGWTASVTNASHIRALKWALTGPSPVDRGRTGSKHHLICDAAGIPIGVTLTSRHRNDVTQLLPLVDGIGPIRGKSGRPHQRAEQLIADRGDDHDKYHRELWKRGVKPVIARRNTERLGPGQASLDRRADLRVAARLSTSPAPLGAPARAARGVHAPRLRGDLPALPADDADG